MVSGVRKRRHYEGGKRGHTAPRLCDASSLLAVHPYGTVCVLGLRFGCHLIVPIRTVKYSLRGCSLKLVVRFYYGTPNWHVEYLNSMMSHSEQARAYGDSASVATRHQLVVISFSLLHRERQEI